MTTQARALLILLAACAALTAGTLAARYAAAQFGRLSAQLQAAP